jgi:hypothetical protein
MENFWGRAQGDLTNVRFPRLADPVFERAPAASSACQAALPNAHGSPCLPHMSTLTTPGEPREMSILHVPVQGSTCPCSTLAVSMLSILDGKEQMSACRMPVEVVGCTVESPAKMPGRRVVEQGARRMRRQAVEACGPTARSTLGEWRALIRASRRGVDRLSPASRFLITISAAAA